MTDECGCVVVARSLDPNAERIKLPTNADNTLGLQTLKGAFPGAHGLKYKNPATGEFWGLLIDPDGTKFRPPPGGWAKKVFLVLSSKDSSPGHGTPFTDEEVQYLHEFCGRGIKSNASSRSSTPIFYEQLQVEDFERYRSFHGYLRYTNIPREQRKGCEPKPDWKGCVTIISDRYAATNSHVAVPDKWDDYRKKCTDLAEEAKKSKNPKMDPGLKKKEDGIKEWAKSEKKELLGKSVVVHKLGEDQLQVETKIVYVDIILDIVVLFSIDGGLLDEGLMPLGLGTAETGNNYMLLGLPVSPNNGHQGLSMLKGNLANASRKAHNKGYILGAYGADHGYSGGPVIRLGANNDLLGIVVSGTRDGQPLVQIIPTCVFQDHVIDDAANVFLDDAQLEDMEELEEGKKKRKRRRESNGNGEQDSKKQRCSRRERSASSEDVFSSEMIVMGMPSGVEEDTLREYFEQFGPVVLSEISRGQDGSSRGFGFIQMSDYKDQVRIISTVDHHTIAGSKCEVQLSNADTNPRIYVYGLSENIGSERLGEFFTEHLRGLDESGAESICNVYYPDPFRNFAFITLSSANAAKELVRQSDFVIDGCPCKVVAAYPERTSQGVQIKEQPPKA